jgi:hypothetical protein
MSPESAARSLAAVGTLGTAGSLSDRTKRGGDRTILQIPVNSNKVQDLKTK